MKTKKFKIDTVVGNLIDNLIIDLGNLDFFSVSNKAYSYTHTKFLYNQKHLPSTSLSVIIIYPALEFYLPWIHGSMRIIIE
ncbi:hypothetical protein DERF_013099 [Dermatophagoides farinae]|uniref:Uncharacterized protein n=1 Tax=Dermatophagoides farinae TaxID=6954 RepID=A0A922HNZ6_DERFA|nr:hypothetical protein DERF_013099 [Dermatophagoides farinae]